ncbi:polysaccharide deacetylase family protein [Robinsoniella peoriensis]|uniref:polysaccharide deacetylase family protein n=1 Tax=Robinsoniella peoriensis TaxID=180332 RepID=UPI001FA74C27|nr:polysaccharide deacetylase family protein [Robinsoniella peoriensis]
MNCSDRMRATFNLNGGLYAPEESKYPEEQIYRRMSKSMVDGLYQQDGIEVAIHGFTHPWLDHMPVNMCTKELMDDRQTLEKQFSRIVRGMAYPFGAYNDDVVAAMRSVGVVYSRTCQATHDFNMPNDWIRLPATCHHADPKLMELADRFLNENSWGRPWMFYLWGHSYEFDEQDNWKVIEDFVKLLAGRDNIWYATNIEIYDYQDAYKRLLFSMDGKIVTNPTAYELWYWMDDTVHSVKAGETVTNKLSKSI